MILFTQGIFSDKYQSTKDADFLLLQKPLLQGKRLGFSFIECLLVITILGLLLSFSYSNYLQYLINVRRHEAQTGLMDLANRLEQFWATHHSYEAATIGAKLPTDISETAFSLGKCYILKITLQTRTAFKLEAIPQGVQAQDRECQTLTLNQYGIKDIASGPYGTPLSKGTRCWK